jgi:hypothetical protein
MTASPVSVLQVKHLSVRFSNSERTDASAKLCARCTTLRQAGID